MAADVCEITDWHIHVYYDAASRTRAETVRERAERAFPDARFGRWHDKPVGPHPDWSFQIAFPPELFSEIVPWMALNRDGLTILLHPNSGDDLRDHRDYALWMGAVRALDLGLFEC